MNGDRRTNDGLTLAALHFLHGSASPEPTAYDLLRELGIDQGTIGNGHELAVRRAQIIAALAQVRELGERHATLAAFDIHVNPLVIAGQVGKCIHEVLGDHELRAPVTKILGGNVVKRLDIVECDGFHEPQAIIDWSGQFAPDKGVRCYPCKAADRRTA